MRQQNGLSDADAVRRVLSGRRDDFSVLVRRYLPAMEALAYSATGSRPDAEDVAQDSFIQAFQHLNRLREPERFGAWLATIVKNTALTLLRRRARRAESIEKVQERPGSEPPVEQRELHAFLRREIGRLDAAHRDVLLLHYFAGLPTNEIANVLNISRSAVLKRLERGRRALGEHLVEALGQDLRAQAPRVEEKVPRVMGVVASLSAPWMTGPSAPATGSLATTTGKMAGTPTVPPKTWPLAATTKAIVFAGVSLTVVGAVLLLKGWLGSASAVVPVAETTPVTGPVAETAVVAEPASPPEVAPQAAMAASPEPSPGVEKTEDTLLADLPPRNETPRGYPGNDSAGARRHTVEGEVFDPERKPLPGARVWAARAGWGVPDTRETTSDAQGRFTFQLPDGKWMLLAAKGTLGGEADLSPSGEFVLEGTPSTLQTMVWTEERSLIQGQLFDQGTGEPISGGKVFTDALSWIAADEEGRFVVEGLRPQDHTLVAVAPGHKRQYVLYSTALCREAMLEVGLEPGVKITGTVTDVLGRPVSNAWVRPLGSGYRCLNGYWELCDSRGRFEYDGLPLEREFRLEATWPCYINGCNVPEPGKTEWKGTLSASRTPAPLNLVLPEGPAEELRLISFLSPQTASAVIRGRVVDPAGAPVRRFHIRLGLARPSSGGKGHEIHYGEPGVLFTSEDGTFALTSDADVGNEKRLIASADGYRDAVIERVAFKPLGASRSSEVVTLRLGEASSVRVQVREGSASGRPIEGARVTLAEPFWNVKDEGLRLDQIDRAVNRPRHAATDAQGYASFSDVAMTDGVVRVDCEGFATDGVAWDGKATLVVVALEPECILEGEVLAEDGVGAPRGTGFVVLKGSRDGSSDAREEDAVRRGHDIFPEDGGRFRITGLPPRDYRLRLTWREREANERVLLNNSPEQGVLTTTPSVSNAVAAAETRVSRTYDDVFTLEAGQILHVSYPRDDVAQNPERLAEQESESPSDVELHRKIIGVWTRPWASPEGANVFDVLYLGEDGERWMAIFASAVAVPDGRGGLYQKRPHVTVFSGQFNVVDGILHYYDERGHSWWPSLEIEGDTIGYSSQAVKATYTRWPEGLERALQEAEAATGASLDRDLLTPEELGLR